MVALESGDEVTDEQAEKFARACGSTRAYWKKSSPGAATKPGPRRKVDAGLEWPRRFLRDR
jgi:hypothetical protein